MLISLLRLLIILTFLCFYPKQNVDIIYKSTVLIEVNDNGHISYGSGIILNKHKKQYILTNSHICLSTHFVGKDQVIIPIKNLAFKFTSAQTTSEEKIKSSIMISDQYNDICLIPLTKYHPEALYVLNENFINNFKNNYLLNNFWGKFYYYTYNRKEYKEVYKIEGDLIYKKQFGKSYKKTDSLFLSMQTIDGDSGSAIFNVQNELVGIIYGNSYHGLGSTLDQIIDIYRKI